jgi:hypothetical protein
MPESETFKRGDAVYHPLRPEWGRGVVHQATTIVHEGKTAQRLVVEFANHGRTTLNTALANLVTREGNIPIMADLPTSRFNTPTATVSVPPRNGGGWLDNLDQSRTSGEQSELWKLPESMNDPFLPLSKRIEGTLASFRFGNDPRHPRNLLDWAVAQTGLNDPLTKYSRHELEQGFRRFIRDRDNHLFELVRLLKRQSGQNLLAQMLQAQTDPLAKQTLERALRA